MLDTLPKVPKKNESFIFNLNRENQEGSHWVAVKKRGLDVEYYDSYGDLQPPQELLDYLPKKSIIRYNYCREQRPLLPECGHLCIEFLLKPDPLNVTKIYE